MEGSVLYFGLMAILVVILICKGRNGWRWWVALGVASGLTLASKHSGIVFVAAALGWVIIRQIQMHVEPPSRQDNTRINHRDTETKQRKQTIGKTVMRALLPVGVSVVITLGVFIALSPAQWNNPVARLGDLVSERAKLLESQVKAEPSAPTPLIDRVAGIFTQPYVQAPVYFEAAFWANAKAIQAEIAEYDRSIWSGLHAGTVIGGLLTLLALVGVVILARVWRTWEIGVLVWLAITVASLLINPLPWQRYYLALYPLAALLTAIGTVNIIRWISQRRSSA